MTDPKKPQPAPSIAPPARFDALDPDFAAFSPTNVLAAEVARLAERLAATERELFHLRLLTLPVDVRTLRHLAAEVPRPSPVNSMTATEHAMREARRAAALRELAPHNEIDRINEEIAGMQSRWSYAEELAARIERVRAAWAAHGWAVAPGTSGLKYVPGWLEEIDADGPSSFARALSEVVAEHRPSVVILARRTGLVPSRHGADDAVFIPIRSVEEVDRHFGDHLHHTDRAKLVPYLDHTCTADRVRVIEDFDVMIGERWRQPRVGDLVRSPAGGAATVAMLEAQLANVPARTEADDERIRALRARREALVAALTGGAS